MKIKIIASKQSKRDAITMNLILNLKEANLIIKALKNGKTESLENDHERITFDPKKKLFKRIMKIYYKLESFDKNQNAIKRNVHWQSVDKYPMDIYGFVAFEKEIRKKIIIAQLGGKDIIELDEFTSKYDNK